MSAALVVTITASSTDEAETIARALIAERLAACVQAHPIESRFHWQGEVARESEVMLTVKTRADLFTALENRVLALHSYEVPEIVAMPVVAGHGPYLDWIAGETQRSG